MNLAVITFEYNNRELDHVDSFIKDLKKDYDFVHAKPKWIPAASEGGEIWLEILFNLSFRDYYNALVKSLAVSGTIYLLKKLFEHLNKLIDLNKEKFGARIIRIKLKYDDIDVLVGRVDGNFTSVFSGIFNELNTKVPKFKRDLYERINLIELPMSYHEKIDKPGYSKYSLITYYESVQNYETYLGLWQITYMDGMERRVYDFSTDQYYDVYENRVDIG